jgi:hypothetical protein
MNEASNSSQSSGRQTTGLLPACFLLGSIVAVVALIAEAGNQLADSGKQALAGGGDKMGVFSGVVRFDGSPPEPELIVKMGDQSIKDFAVCAAHDIRSEQLVVNKENKGIANVFVYLAKAPAGAMAPKPAEPEVVFDQKGCRFLPHGLVVQTGQTVLVKSGDPIPHNTHTAPTRNDPFNKGISPEDRKGIPLKYTKAERTPIEVRCDYHPWMKAYHLVLDHPYMAVTDADGKFTIAGLSPGRHEFVIWHELKGYLDRKHVVEVTAGKTTEVKLSFSRDRLTSFEGPRSRTVAISPAP